MKMLQVTREGVVLLYSVQLANSFSLRLKGLLGKPEPVRGEGLLVCPGSAVHTFGMKYPIDVVFFNRQGVVKKIAGQLLPGRCVLAVGTSKILEMRAGTLVEHNIRVNDVLQMDFYHDEK